jgi:hypothetical protein
MRRTIANLAALALLIPTAASAQFFNHRDVTIGFDWWVTPTLQAEQSLSILPIFDVRREGYGGARTSVQRATFDGTFSPPAGPLDVHAGVMAKVDGRASMARASTSVFLEVVNRSADPFRMALS